MAVGWWRDTSDNKLMAATDSAMDVPTGHDFILETTIAAVYDGTIWQGGTWDGTDYEPPDNILVGYDSTTDAGMVKDAAHDMMDVFDGALELIARYPSVWTLDQTREGHRGHSLANRQHSPCCLERHPHGGRPSEDMRGIRVLADWGEWECTGVRGRYG